MASMNLQDLPSPSSSRPTAGGSYPLFSDYWKSSMPLSSPFIHSFYSSTEPTTPPGISYYPAFNPLTLTPLAAFLPSSSTSAMAALSERAENNLSGDSRTSSIASLRMKAKEHIDSLGKDWKITTEVAE